MIDDPATWADKVKTRTRVYIRLNQVDAFKAQFPNYLQNGVTERVGDEEAYLFVPSGVEVGSH
jgi:hypothetical protein